MDDGKNFEIIFYETQNGKKRSKNLFLNATKNEC